MDQSLCKTMTRTLPMTSPSLRNPTYVGTTRRTTRSSRSWRATKRSQNINEHQETRASTLVRTISRRRLTTNSQSSLSISSKRSLRISATWSFWRSSTTSWPPKSWAICIPAAWSGSWVGQCQAWIRSWWLMIMTRSNTLPPLSSSWTSSLNRIISWGNEPCSISTCWPSGTLRMGISSCSTRSSILGSWICCFLTSSTSMSKMRTAELSMIWAASSTPCCWLILASIRSKRRSRSWIWFQGIR